MRSSCGYRKNGKTAAESSRPGTVGPIGMSDGKRLIVIGMDGLDWSVVDVLMEQGKLPHFGEAITAGASWVLRSTTPPVTPAAWSTLFSGVPPREHGVFDFTAREAGRYRFRLCSATDRQAEMIWTLASERGRRVVVLNVPMTYPATPVNGIMVSGMDAPDLPGAVSPRAALATVLARSPCYTVDAMSHWFAERKVFFTNLWKMHRARHRLAMSLVEKADPELFICVYVIADRVQHVAWRDPPTEEVTTAYEALDAVLGDYLDRLRPEDELLLISDHGFQRLEAEICLNKVLSDAGLLVLDRSRCRTLLAKVRQRWVHTRSVAERPDGWWSLPPRALWFDAVDWPRTRCVAFGLYGNLVINLRGRDPQGVVDQRRESASLLGDVEDLVSSILGERGEIRVHPIAWDHGSQRRISPPDAVVEMAGYRVATWGGREFYAPAIVGANAEGHTGVHSPEGVCLAVGPAFGSGSGRRGQADALDIAPTILELLGLTQRRALPGRLLMGR
ncbi:MAG: hypothetical protein GY835_23345 [bacterium]|nr:hypothetical protein [bacterium]